MATRFLTRKLHRLEALAARRNGPDHPVLVRLRDEPAQLMVASGMPPDPWQEKLLGSEMGQILLLCSRQSGKSTVAAALALHTALSRPRSPVLLLSPSLRQSSELFRKVLELFGALGRPMAVVGESALRLERA